MEIWKLFKRQKEAFNLIEDNKFTLLVGQGRASKTTLVVWYLFYRAWKYPNTSHVIFRNTLTSALDGIFSQTVKEVLTHFYPLLVELQGFSINKSTHTIIFPNGSRIMIRGLDSQEKATKILSQQFATVALDEVQTIDYTYFSLLLTRLPQPADCDYDVKIICSSNYAPRTHWSKVFFVDGNHPETRLPHFQNSAYLKFNTEDNIAIDAEEYIKTIQNAGDRRARLMCASDDWFDEVEGALWTLQDISRADIPEDYEDIVLAYDPAVSNNKNSDEHGVCIACKKDEKYYVIKCFEEKSDVNEFTKKVAGLYHSYGCSKLIYESNQGGKFIESLIHSHDKSIYCEEVRANKGKMLRAEPVAQLYKSGVVFHCGGFPDLENQMISFSGGGDSPNCLDSLVYAVKYLHESNNYVDPNRI